MKDIPLKNYVITLIISLITVIAVFNLMNVYNNRTDKLSFITEVSENNLNYYITERNELLIYMTYGCESKKFKEKFKSYLESKEIRDDIIYVDLSNTNDNFGKLFKSSIDFKKVAPSLILIENGQVKDSIVNIKNYKQVEEFIERSHIR